MNKREIKRKIDDAELACEVAISDLRITFQYLARDEAPPEPALRLEAGCEVVYHVNPLDIIGTVLFVDYQSNRVFVRSLAGGTFSADITEFTVTKEAIPGPGDYVLLDGRVATIDYVEISPNHPPYFVMTMTDKAKKLPRSEFTVIAQHPRLPHLQEPTDGNDKD